MRTTNEGVSWTGARNTHPTSAALSGFFTDINTGYIVGEGGLIMKTTTGGVTFVKEKDKLINPSDFDLYQNYPNPFNPSTEIKFKLTKRTYVTLTIYDLLGRNIRTLFKGEKEPGVFSFDFKPGNISTGIYLYQLLTPSTAISKKMIYIK